MSEYCGISKKSRDGRYRGKMCNSNRPAILLLIVTRFSSQISLIVTKYFFITEDIIKSEPAYANERRRYRLRYLRDRVSECKCVEPNSLWRWIVIRRIGRTQQLHWETRHCGPDIDANAFHACAGTSNRRRHRRHSDANSTTSIDSHVRVDKNELLKSHSDKDNRITWDKKNYARDVCDRYKSFILSSYLRTLTIDGNVKM